MKSQNQFSIGHTVIKAVIAGAVVFGAVNTAGGQTTKPAGPSVVTEGVGADGRVRMVVNRSQLLTTKGHKRVSVAQSEIADVNPISPTGILVTAKKPGSTQIIIWDDQDRAQIIEVLVDFDLVALNDAFKTQFPNAKIEATAANGSIMLRGRAPNLDAAEQAAALAAPYGKEGGKVLNFLEIAGGQQVMLQVRFAEVSRVASTQLGVNLGFSDGTAIGGTNNSGAPGFSIITEDRQNFIGIPQVTSGYTLFGNGQVGSTLLTGYINALRNNNLLRVLAEPNLIAISGQEASFLAGGEIPIPVPQAGTGAGTTITIEYKEFGVGLKFTPVVLGDGKIRLKCAPEVSDLDYTNAVTLQGFQIPALTKRNLQTTVEMREGQTLALAGLLNSRISSGADVTPLLGDIPILGALFRSTRYTRQETELVVLVTPRLVSGMNPDQVPAVPGEKWRSPTEGELFWLRDLGGEVPSDKKIGRSSNKPARFQGTYGFTPVEQKPAANVPATPTTGPVAPAKPAATSVQPTTKAAGN
jgi:pilus assembly protein CpaC